jgi:putative SOS response-associated peptidase YedK
LWELWEREAPPLLSFAILTRPNDAIPPPLVPDGPVFLSQDQWQDWITQRPWFVAQRLARLPQPALSAYRVSRAIRDPHRDDYTLMEPVPAGDDDVALADEDAQAWDEDGDE